MFLVIICSAENSNSDLKKLDIYITQEMQNNKINLFIHIKNKENQNCYIPYDYLNFYCESEDGDYEMVNNWLYITDDYGKEVPYKGYMVNFIKIRQKYVDYYFLARNQECIIYLQDIQSNYVISNTKWITLQYNGPLGKSNKIKIDTRKIFH